jgi:hypothetical protein
MYVHDTCDTILRALYYSVLTDTIQNIRINQPFNHVTDGSSVPSSEGAALEPFWKKECRLLIRHPTRSEGEYVRQYEYVACQYVHV